MDRISRDRVKWKCRRGLLELDLVLERFIPSLREQDLREFDALLDLPDQRLWDVVAGRSDDYEPRLQHIVARLRAA